jgi:transcriptional regulator with XRE-family HTH domain
MTGEELRERLDRLRARRGLLYKDVAPLLGLTLAGLNHQMRGVRAVTPPTVLLLERLEAEQDRADAA